jgi:mxaC protein
MSFGVTTAPLLTLLPLALLPLLMSAQRPDAVPSLDILARDRLSAAIDIGLRLLAALAIAGLVMGIAGLHVRGESVNRVGEGANLVLLLDRSASMDQNFAGRQTGDDAANESKADAAKRLLTEFVASRKADRFGVVAFSTSPMPVLPLTDRPQAVTAAIAATDRPGLAFTDVGRGLLMALGLHDLDAAQGGRAILLVSDGAAVIDRKVQDALRAAVAKRPVNLYWLFLRTAGSRGIFDPPRPGEEDTPQALPERHLNIFLRDLGAPYRAFEAENPQAVAEAIAEIDRLERRPITYVERVPQRDLAVYAYGLAAFCLSLLVLAKLAEVRLPSGLSGARS